MQFISPYRFDLWHWLWLPITIHHCREEGRHTKEIGLNSGIYQIQSILLPSRVYVGSAKNIRSRKLSHLNCLRNGKHANYILQAHCKKYGINDLVFTTLEPCSIDQLIPREQHYIDTLKPSFNICKRAGNTIGRPQSEETKRKRGEAIKRYYQNNPAETRPQSEESKINRSLSQQARHKAPDEINHFFLLSESTARVHSGKRSHVYLCLVCGNISLLTAMQVRKGTSCKCRRIYAVRVAKLKKERTTRTYTRDTLVSTNTTGYCGVVWDKARQMYRARIKLNGKLLSVGQYYTGEEAHAARLNKLKELNLLPTLV